MLGALLLSGPALAQDSWRGAWVDVNVTPAQSSQNAQELVTVGVLSGGSTLTLAQRPPEGAAAPASTYTFGSGLGFGARFVRLRFSTIADVSITAPHQWLPGVAFEPRLSFTWVRRKLGRTRRSMVCHSMRRRPCSWTRGRGCSMTRITRLTRSDSLQQGPAKPLRARLKRTVTIRLDEPTIVYFKALADETGIAYQMECRGRRRQRRCL